MFNKMLHIYVDAFEQTQTHTHTSLPTIQKYLCERISAIKI